ncbi:MAG: non-canonical purine NTP pyrophosphatase [bacterium]|jgi:XTP/dITP diphosphohydrolase
MELKTEYNNTINILIATGNAHKFQEIQEILRDYADINPVFLDKNRKIEIIEDGKTYEDNAKIKVEGCLNYLNENPDLKKSFNISFILSEDSGLEVECLGEAPGLFTARYAGENASNEDNIDKLLYDMTLEKKCSLNRRAKFVCYACLYDIQKKDFRYFYGELKGLIANSVSGSGGFGYDPIFIVPEFNKTAAQIDAFQKNAISHRAAAIKKAADKIKELCNK